MAEFIFRAVKAKHGDSLLLLADGVKVLIDGGPSGVYSQALRDQLSDLQRIFHGRISVSSERVMA